MYIYFKQSICRDYMAPQVHLSYDKQLTTADQFFGKIYKLFLSQSAKLEHEKDYCSKS